MSRKAQFSVYSSGCRPHSGTKFNDFIFILFKLIIYFISSELRADDFGTATDDEPAGTSFSGHVYSESLEGLSSPPVVH